VEHLDSLNLGCPSLDLALPLEQHCGGADNETWARAARGVEARPERYHLQRLTQSHLVAQDAAHLLLVQLPQPLQARALMGEEAPPQPAGHRQPGHALLVSAVALLAGRSGGLRLVVLEAHGGGVPRRELGDFLL